MPGRYVIWWAMESETPSSRDDRGTSASGGSQTPSPLRSLQIVWGALICSLGSYVGVAYVVTAHAGSAAESAPVATMELAFAVAAVGCLGVSYLLPRKLLRTALAKEDVATIALEKLLPHAFSAWILRMALTESVVIFGLVLAMMSGQPQKVLPFVILSLLAMITAIPTERALRAAAQP